MRSTRAGRSLLTERSKFFKLFSRQDNVEFFDDFLGDLVEDGWGVLVDTGGTVNQGTAAASGVLTFTTDGTDDDVASASHELNWLPSQSCLFECRIKWDVVTTLGFFCGFTDARTEAGSTMPWALATTSYTSTASDGFGFLFDTDATTDTIRCVGVKADVDGTNLDSAIVPVAGTYINLRCAITPGETASYWIDDVLIGTVALASTAATKLCPYVAHKNMSAAAHVGSLDYVYCAQSRT